jgi:hypothetical protein
MKCAYSTLPIHIQVSCFLELSEINSEKRREHPDDAEAITV